jgi:hypothetical protein
VENHSHNQLSWDGGGCVWELKGWCESEMNSLLKRDAPEKEKTSGTSSVSEKEQDGGSGGLKRQPDVSGKLKRKAGSDEEDGVRKRVRIDEDGDDGEGEVVFENEGSEELKDPMGNEDARAYEAVFGGETPSLEE